MARTYAAPQERRRAPYVTLACAGCGSSVDRRVSDLRSGAEVYCTRDCFRVNGRARMQEGGRPRSANTITVETSEGVKSAVIEDGYVYLYWASHPSANRAGRVAAHRVVMEDLLGRRLLPGETVHHRDGSRANNAPANLELWVHAQPPGQRVEDAAAWAREVLGRYGTPDERERFGTSTREGARCG